MISPAFGLALEAQVTSIKALVDCYGPWVGIRSNHVISSLGEFSGPDGSSRSISTPEDKELLIALRAQADLVVVDANTGRSEQYRLASSGAKLAIFSATGDFTDIPAFDSVEGSCYLFSPQIPKNISNNHHVLIDSVENPLSDLSAWARDNGMPAVLLEAGPTLTKLAFRNGLVSQSALTIAGKYLDPETVATRHPFDPLAKLLSVATGEGASFTYWSH
jgi:riboflavin biosynthesis pyrimidine reductase